MKESSSCAPGQVSVVALLFQTHIQSTNPLYNNTEWSAISLLIHFIMFRVGGQSGGKKEIIIIIVKNVHGNKLDEK